MLRNVRNSFQLRLAHCQAVEGTQFEHLIIINAHNEFHRN